MDVLWEKRTTSHSSPKLCQILFLQLPIGAHCLMFENTQDKQIYDVALNVP